MVLDWYQDNNYGNGITYYGDVNPNLRLYVIVMTMRLFFGMSFFIIIVRYQRMIINNILSRVGGRNFRRMTHSFA